MEQVVKSVADLVREGWSKTFLYEVCHMKNTPAFRLCTNGKFYFVESDLIEFVNKLEKK